MKADAISIVEAAYDYEADHKTWFVRLLEQAAPKLDRGFGVTVSTYVPGMRTEDVIMVGHFRPPELMDAGRAMIAAYPEIFHRVLSSGAPYEAPTQNLGITPAETRHWPPYVEHAHRLGVREFVGLVARDPSGHAIFFSAPSPDLRRPTRGERLSWSRIAAHISAGARLRRALPGLTSADLAAGAEAILSPSGSIAHAEVAAQSRGAKASLRNAVLSMDRARSKVRANEAEALDLWQGLVAGRWSLVDRFDTDGRRYLVARKNDPDVKDPRALTPRERHVLAYVAMGHPLKLIAYALGLSLSTVSVNRQMAMRKLGLRTHADIVTLFAPTPPVEPPHGR
jgi:DNA-binding CsgD family transcriptional regulator